MRSSRSFRRPTARAVLVAAAAGAVLLPIAGLAGAAAPASSPQLTRATAVPTDTAHGPSTSPALSLAVPALDGDESLQTTSPAQQSGQSLDGLAASSLPDGALGIPAVMLDAYQRAEREMAETQPGCHLSWSTLAGIGHVESGHASGGRVDAAGNTLGPILGPQLDGSMDTVAIADTDRGTLDADLGWDRAVGPMQFIPASWRVYGAGNPNNIYDSTLAAGRYLCTGGADLADPAQEAVAVYRYNHSMSYVSNVLLWAHGYLTGVVPTPSEQGSVPQSTDGNQALQVRTVAQSTPQVVAQLDSPAVANLDSPAAARLDAPQPAAAPATATSSASLDSPTTPSASAGGPASLDSPTTESTGN